MLRIRSIRHISLAIRIIVFEPASWDLVTSKHLVVEALQRRVVPARVMLLSTVITVLRGPVCSLLVGVVPVHVGVRLLVSVITLIVAVIVGIVVAVVILVIVIVLFVVIGGVSSVVVLLVGLRLLVVIMLGTWWLRPLVVGSRRGRLIVRTISRVLVVRTRRGRLRVGSRARWRGAVRWSVMGPGAVGRRPVRSVHSSISTVVVIRRSWFVVLHSTRIMGRSHWWGAPTRHPSGRPHRP